jgi:methylglutaconyl-CoA hydratase
MTFNTLKLDFEKRVATLTLNRPEKRNAISPAMVEEIPAALDEVEHSPAQVVILTGAGKAFCSGMDLEALKAMAVRIGTEHHALKGEMPQPSHANLADSRRMARMFRRVYDFPKPLIAAVNGPALAGGCGLATLCDFTLAVPEAKFGYTEVRIGFLPAIVSVFLIRQIGEKKAREVMLAAQVFDAAEAHRLGLVSEIVPPERLMERARDFAQQLSDYSPTGVTYTKRFMTELKKQELDRELELAIQENARIRSTPDFYEGLTAFLEKRKPVWNRE